MNRIVTVDTEINNGVPSVRGVPVVNVLDRLKEGVLHLEKNPKTSRLEILGMFPGNLSYNEIAACLDFAAQNIR